MARHIQVLKRNQAIKAGMSLVEVMMAIVVIGAMLTLLAPVYTLAIKLSYNTRNFTPLSKVVYMLQDMDMLYRGHSDYMLVKYGVGVPTETTISEAQGIAFKSPHTTSDGVLNHYWVSYQVTPNSIIRHTWHDGDAISTKKAIYYGQGGPDVFHTDLTESNWRNSTIAGYNQNVYVRNKYYQTTMPFFIPKE